MEKMRFDASDRGFQTALLHRLPLDVLRGVRLLVRPDTVLRLAGKCRIDDPPYRARCVSHRNCTAGRPMTHRRLRYTNARSSTRRCAAVHR
jgi:putative transposase